MPRAPQSRALLAGRPLAKRSVFSTSTSRTRSIPLSSDISTRLTRGNRRQPAVRMPNEGVGGGEVGQGSGMLRRQAFQSDRDTVRARRTDPRGACAGFGLGAERRGDLDFDLAIGCFR